MRAASSLALNRAFSGPQLRAWVGASDAALAGFDHVGHDPADDKPNRSHEFTLLKIRKPGCSPASGDRFSLSRSSKNRPASPDFLTRDLSEMTHKPSEITFKASELASRDRSVARAQAYVHELAKPVEPGENIKNQLLRAFRAAVKGLPGIKYSRIRDFWHGDKRIQVRDWETEGLAVALALKQRISNTSSLAGRAQHDAREAMGAVRALIAGAGHRDAGPDDLRLGGREE